MSALVYVHPAGQPDVEAAVRAGGGEIVELARANGIVCTENDYEWLRDALHPGVAWVQLGSAGVENWLEEGVIDDSRAWAAAKGAYGRSIAEYVVGMLIAAARGGTYAEPGGRLLAGSTVGILGAGGIGSVVLALLAPFDVRVLALTWSGREVPGAARSLGPTQLDELLAESDFVVVTAPLTAATTRLLDERALALMRPTAWLVNVARGGIVDTDALTRALTAGRLGGAVLDVTDPEPLPDDHPLRGLPNVVLTPHVSSSADSDSLFAARVTENVGRFVRGEELLGLVDLRRGY